MSPRSIGIIGFDGVTASHLTGPADALAIAALDDGFGGRISCYRVWTIGPTTRPFTAESGWRFEPRTGLEEAPPLDTIIVAGGRGAREIGEPLAEWILGRACETRRLASICTGLYALAPTGLLDGREVTTHWRAARDLQERYPALRVNHKRRLIKDGAFHTAAGLSGGVDLALALIEEDYGPQVALSLSAATLCSISNQRRSLTKSDNERDSPSIDRFGSWCPG